MALPTSNGKSIDNIAFTRKEFPKSSITSITTNIVDIAGQYVLDITDEVCPLLFWFCCLLLSR